MYRSRVINRLRQLRKHIAPAVICLLAFGVQYARAQQGYVSSIGLPTFTTATPVELGVINLANGNLHLEIPIGTAPQRGRLQMQEKLVYDSRIWVPVNTGTGTVWQPSEGGWRFVTGTETGAVSHSTVRTKCSPEYGGGSYTDYENFAWTAPDGTVHTFSQLLTEFGDNMGCGVDSPTGDALADDGSGYHMYVTSYTSATVYRSDGTQVYPTWKDTNGNYFSTDSNGNLIDTLDRTVVTKTTGTNQFVYNVLNSQGSTYQITENTTTVTPSTSFNVSGITDCNPSTNCTSTITEVTSVVLPGGAGTYSFDYDSYGEVTRITLPTTGQVTFSYTNFADASGQTNRWVTGRTSGGGTWSYTPSVVTACSSQGGQQQVTVGKPSGDSIVYTFVINNGAWATQAVYKGSGGTTLATTTQTYTPAVVAGCTTNLLNDVHLASETTTLPGANGTNISTQKQFTYDSVTYGNITALKEWNFYTGSPGATPDRETDTTYQTASAYMNANIIDLPLTVTVYSAGAKVAQTTYAYDSTALGSITGITQHDDTNFGTANTTRGNVTSVSRWTSNSTNAWPTTIIYDTTGQVTSVKDAANNTTYFSYGDNFYNDNGSNPPSPASPAGPTNAYLTSASVPIIGARTYGYYLGTGKSAFTTDQNSASTYWHYLDGFDRPTQTNAPAGGWSLLNYASTTQVDSYTGLSTTTPSTGCTGCLHTEQLLDGLGRVTQNSLMSDPDGQTNVGLSYDGNGRVQSQTNPYRSTSDPTYGSDTTAYDGLERAISVTHSGDSNTYQITYGASVSASQYCGAVAFPVLLTDERGNQRLVWKDAWDRVAEVDEPDGTGHLTVATCYTYSAVNNLTYVSQQGQTRQYLYDGLSRLTSETNPESGTVTYFYTGTGGAPCSGDPSDVCSKTDARGIITTYAYDALNRLTRKSYSDSTPESDYTYDANTVWGLSLQNTKGRLVEEAESNAKRVFSYDAAGRVVNQWDCLPSNCSSGGTYNTAFAYDLAGNLAQITYPSGRIVTYTIGNAARPTQVTFTNANNGGNYVYASALQYSPLGSLSSMTLGNGIKETLGYNNRGQIAQWQAGSSILTAFNRSFTWADSNGKDNGTLMKVTDLLNSNRTQTYGYDALNRLSSAAESGWNTSFVYDTWGNLLQQNATGVPSFSQTISGTSNRLSGYSYDQAGNLTNSSNPTHSYTYDAEDRLVSFDSGATYTYDPDGLRVAQTVNSTATEYIVAGGQLLAERQASGDWSDYVYVNGRLIVKGDSYHDRLHTHGTNSCGNCGEWTAFAFPNAAGYNGYVIRNGDKLFLRQWQASGSQGGMIISFSDGTNTSWSVMDQNGTYMNQDTSVTTWDYRRFDLSSFAGKTISAISLVTESSTQAGNWDIYYSDIALFSTDGTVGPIYNRETGISLSVSGTSGVSNISYGISRVSGVMPSYDTTTNYYHSDQIGSGRMVSSVNGYPVWQATYTPFGYEYNQELGINRLKFATYQRDLESGLDYAKFRFYNPQMNRFMSPDPADMAAMSLSNPQSWNRYAYVLNLPTVLVDPLGRQCTNGISGNSTTGAVDCPGVNQNTGFNVSTTVSAPLPSAIDTFSGYYALSQLNIVSSSGTRLFRPNEEYTPWIDGRRGGYPQRSSPAWAFTRTFFGGLVSSVGWKAVYHSLVDQGGCDNLMFYTFADVFNPLPGDGVGASDVAELGPKAVAGAGQVAASAYSAYQGLSVPLRSSIYRGLQSSTYGYAEAVGEAAPYALVGYAGGKALVTAGSAAYNGECH
jgi:RHS repeat-associated protein